MAAEPSSPRWAGWAAGNYRKGNDDRQQPPDDKRAGPDKNTFLAIGIAIGVAIGSGFGVAIDNIAVGVGAGIAVGVAIGLVLSRRNKDNSEG